MKTLVIYHKADWDGLFSREIARKHFGDDAEYLGWDYGDPMPVVELGREVVMIDISVDGLMDHRPLVWIDHHKSAMAKFAFATPGYRIDGVAACRLAWQYFSKTSRDAKTFALPDKQAFVNRLVHEPYAVQLAGEYDIWDKRNPDADLFQYGLGSCELDWEKLLESDRRPSIAEVEAAVGNGEAVQIKDNGDIVPLYVSKLLNQGRPIEFSSAEANASLMRDVAFELNWEGMNFLAINKPRGNSRTFAGGVKPEHDALLTFYWLRNKWRVSLYGSPHHPEHDLSLIAVKHGGGGHKQACGFESKTLPFALA